MNHPDWKSRKANAKLQWRVKLIINILYDWFVLSICKISIICTLNDVITCVKEGGWKLLKRNPSLQKIKPIKMQNKVK